MSAFVVYVIKYQLPLYNSIMVYTDDRFMVS